MDLDVEPGKVDIHTLKNTCNEHGSTNTIILELLLCMCKGMCPHSSPYLKELPPVIPPVLQQRDSGTFVTAFIRFVLMMIRIPLQSTK